MELCGPPKSITLLHETPCLRIAQPVLPAEAILEGPPYTLTLQWFLCLPGAEYLGLYLWLAKDACWSQLRWAKTALVFGLLALLWLTGMMTGAFRARLYSEVYLAFGLFLWLFANFCWMAGDFSSLWFVPNDDRYEVLGNTAAKYLLLSSVVTFVIFFTILLPRDVFASDRDSLKYLEYTSPACPVVFREFRIWASLHLLAWATKDCLWAWDLAVPYAVAFLFTIVLNIDLIYRLSVYSLQYINLVHSVIMILWVGANGMWALGELNVEETLTQRDYQLYTFVLRKSMLVDPAFEPRWVAGWMFLMAGCVWVVFYIQWTIVWINGRVPNFDEFRAACTKAILDEGN